MIKEISFQVSNNAVAHYEDNIKKYYFLEFIDIILYSSIRV